MHKRNLNLALINNFANGVFYFLSVYFIAKDNNVAFIGTMIGSSIVVYVMARKKRE